MTTSGIPRGSDALRRGAAGIVAPGSPQNGTCYTFRLQPMWESDKVWESPLRFASRAEAVAFGKAMYDPPQTVSAHMIETRLPANASFRAGRVWVNGRKGK